MRYRMISLRMRPCLDFKMAASAARLKRRNPGVDYKELNPLCPTDMYEPITKRGNKVSKSEFYVVDRIISKRQSKQVCDHNRTFNNH